MYFWQFLLQTKRFYTAMVLFAAGIIIAFSTVNGDDAATDANDLTAKTPVSNANKAAAGNGNPEKSLDSNDGASSVTVTKPDNQDDMSIPTRPERVMSVGIRMIYAPKSAARQWPLGNRKYVYLNAQDFELKYKLWKDVLSDKLSDSLLASTPPAAYIESERYYGTLSDSGELSGWGEWKVVVNNRNQGIRGVQDALSLVTPSSRTANSDNSGASVNGASTSPDSRQNANKFGMWNVELFLNSEVKILLTDFDFYDGSEEKTPEPPFESKTKELTPLQVDSEFRYPVEKNIVSACFPNGQTVLYIPSEGTIRFRWKARRLGNKEFQIQSFGGLESLWTIDVPSNQLLSLQPDGLKNDADSLCASVTKEKIEKTDAWRYFIRWSESDGAVVRIASSDGKENQFDRCYQQQTTYTFTPYHVNTQCRITFEPARSGLPPEIPFCVDHDPHVIWEASLDGQPAEINITETGYSISLRKCTTDKARPELLITSISPLSDLKNAIQETENGNGDPLSHSVKLQLPRIDLQSGRWQNGTAVVNTLQSPISIETNKCNVVDFKRSDLHRYQTTIELERCDADVALIIEPYKELFYSQMQTVVQWDGSQASFISTIELHAEEGRLYSLTAVLPDGLIVDQASSDEQPDMIEDWDVYPDAANPAKRTLTIYLRKSLSPERNLVLNIRSHAIADWSKPVELYRLAPIVFDRFESHTQILYVNVALNQRFIVGQRVLYSPELGANSAEPSDDSSMPELPIGIECSPHSSPIKGTGAGRLDAYEFCIDLKMWGKCLASLEPALSDFSVNAHTQIWVDKNSIEEKIELAFSGERSHLSRFRFSYGNSADSPIDWQGSLVWSNNRYKVKVEQVEGNVFSIDIPRNVSSPFTVYLSRKIDWKQLRAFDLLESSDCSRLTTTVSVYSRLPNFFDIHTHGMKYVNSAADNNADLTIGTYEYDLKNDKRDARNDGNPSSLTSDDPVTPRIEISVSKAPQSDVSIWAWNQLVEERHFASGNVLTSAQWTIENRFPPSDSVQTSNTSNSRLTITLPTDPDGRSDSRTFLTGVRIDNQSVSGDRIIQESENVYSILLPTGKKYFVLTVQWTSYDKPLKNYCYFEPQKPTLNIKVLQSSWNLYYPTSYRRFNAYLSSDPSVDGLLERFFGPLLRRDSSAVASIVSHIWDDDKKQTAGKNEKESRELDVKNNSSQSVKIKTDSNLTFPVPYTLSGHSAWNCCQFDGRDVPRIIRIVRSEVSECIRWAFFIITVSIVLTLYFKRISLLRLLNRKDEKRDNEKTGKISWGFRRWICVFGGVCGVLCQTLPWFLSLAFSGAFLGTIVCLLVLAVPFNREKTNNDDSTSMTKSSPESHISSRIVLPISRLFIYAFLFTLVQPAMGQDPVLPPSTRFMAPGVTEHREYEIFVPVDQQNRPQNGYYVPQELLDLMQTREKLFPERSWIVCRTQYYGKLIQRPKQTESGLWKCAIEIETLSPNVAVDLPIRIRETVSASSNVSVSRGRILKLSNPKANEEKSEDSKSEALYWSWDKLDNQTVLHWNPKNEWWGIQLAQPGRYLIEIEFRPTIISADGKNEISFSILECNNSTLELLVSENIAGLEFPGVYGDISESTLNMDITDPSILAQSGMKLKRVELGSVNQLTVRWNSGGFLPDNPVYDVDTITWWNVLPDSVDVRIKYNVKVVSGSVSSMEITADERLDLLSDSSVDRISQNDNEDSKKNDPGTETDADSLKNGDSAERNPEMNETTESRNSSPKTNPVQSQSDIPYSVVRNPDKPGSFTVTFDSPVTSQTSFELHYIWKNAVGVGRLQFPSTAVESSRSGQRALAFTFDSSLQYECGSDTLIPMSAQSFGELWRGLQKQPAPVTENASGATEKGTVRSAADSASNNRVETESVVNPASFSDSPQNEANLPTVAYDLNLSRRKTDSSGVVDSVVMNVQRMKAVSEGTAEAFVLADWDRMLWQIKWTINISRGEQSGYSATLPESMCKPENHLSIISSSVKIVDGSRERFISASASIEGNELKLYWGTPIKGKCQLIVTGELRPDFNNKESASIRTINFDFPEIKTLNVSQYKLAIGRTDDSVVKTIFDKPTPKTVVWTQAELSVETPSSSRNQRLLETWQTTINDTSKKPCALALEIQKNDVAAEIDASVKLVQDNSSALVLNGRVKVTHGIFDEFLLDIPMNCSAPISSKTTLKCELDALSITQRRFILRPLSPFTSDSEFELTIPINKVEFDNWKLEKRGALLWSVVCSDGPQQSDVPKTEKSDATVSKSEQSNGSSAAERSLASETRAFGMKMFVKPINETEYSASAEFACVVSGVDYILVRLPDGSKTLNVQIEQRSVRWNEKNDNEILIPIITENDPVDVRIVYTSAFNRTLYTEPMKFEPPMIKQAQQPEILWMVLPWKNLTHPDPGSVRTTSFINKQIWLINDLNSQYKYLEQSPGRIAPIALERLSRKLNEIESQLIQYEFRGEKPKAKTNSDSLIPRPDTIRRQNLTPTETGAIRLAMQNVLLLRKAINEKQKTNSKSRETVNYTGFSFKDSELLEFQFSTTPPLVCTSAPGTAFVLTYSLPPATAPNASIWQILSMLFIPVIIWLAFFPPQTFVLWRPAFVLGCLSVIWLLYFNLYGVSILLFAAAMIDVINKLHQRSKSNIIPLRVR